MPTPPTAEQLRHLDADDRNRILARYPRRSQRTLGIVLGALLVLTLGPWTLWAGFQQSNPGVHGQVHSFTVVDDSRVQVRLDVHRPDPQQGALCAVQAQADNGAVVGELTVALSPTSDRDVTKQVTIKTSVRATTVVLVECHRV